MVTTKMTSKNTIETGQLYKVKSGNTPQFLQDKIVLVTEIKPVTNVYTPKKQEQRFSFFLVPKQDLKDQRFEIKFICDGKILTWNLTEKAWKDTFIKCILPEKE